MSVVPTSCTEVFTHLTRSQPAGEVQLEVVREAKAVVRAIARAINAEAPLDLETLAWYADSEGAEAIAHALRTRARERELTSTTEQKPEGIHP